MMDLHLKKYDSTKVFSVKARVITGILLATIISACVLSGELTFMLLMVGINELALIEYARLVQMHEFSLQKTATYTTAFLLMIAAWLIRKQVLELSALLLLPAFIPLFFGIELFRKKKYPVETIALSIFGLMWITVPFGLFALIGFLPLDSVHYHPLIVLGYFIILWLSDSGAYFFGKAIGKRKLFERISPNKTWEGFAGGLVLAWIAGLSNFLLLHQLQLSQWLLLALIIYTSGSFGDFAKSMLKRSVGVKDCGTILPGHGGILDRFDSLIGSAPFAFLYLLFYA